MRRYGRKSRQDRRGRALARQHTGYAPAVGSNGRAGAGTQDARRDPLLRDVRVDAAGNEAAPTICYARVSSHDQQGDLDRQQAVLESYCAAKGWRSETLRDLGSGMNYRKKGLNRLLEINRLRGGRRGFERGRHGAEPLPGPCAVGRCTGWIRGDASVQVPSGRRALPPGGPLVPEHENVFRMRRSPESPVERAHLPVRLRAHSRPRHQRRTESCESRRRELPGDGKRTWRACQSGLACSARRNVYSRGDCVRFGAIVSDVRERRCAPCSATTRAVRARGRSGAGPCRSRCG